VSTREALYRLIDELPEDELPEAERYLKALQIDDPLIRALELAPWDDEPETEEERAAVQEAREALARGEVLTTEELRQELGL
jgi:hypothetical protein